MAIQKWLHNCATTGVSDIRTIVVGFEYLTPRYSIGTLNLQPGQRTTGAFPYDDTVRGVWEGIFGQGQRLVRGSPCEGFRGLSPRAAGEVFKLFWKNQWKITIFRPIFDNANENFAIFFKIFKKSRIFR